MSSIGSQRFEGGGRGSDKSGRMAVETQQSTRTGLKCWKCGRQGHIQRNCRQGNSSGTVAMITPGEKLPTSQLD
jgi:hypothetical protein